jgi:hypothetical protein
MKINNILILLLAYMKTNKAKNKDYDFLKDFISKSKVFDGKKKKLYIKINKFKN